MSILFEQDDFVINEIEINDEDNTDKNEEDEFAIEDNDNNEDENNNDENTENEEENSNEEPEEENTDEDNIDKNEEDEFSIEDNEDSNEENNNNDEDTEDNSNEEPEEMTDDLSAIENDIFSSLTTKQKAIKDGELKGQFSSLYNEVDYCLNKLNNLKELDLDTSKILEKITNTLITLKEYIEDYLCDTYETKTYIENMVIYQKYITVFNAIQKALEKIKDKLPDSYTDTDN